MHRKYIYVGAADLDYAEDDTVILGPETSRACERALELQKETNGTIIVTAGWSVKYQTVMGQVMQEFLRDLGSHDVQFRPAHAFNTNGEAEALAEFLRGQHLAPEDTDEVWEVVRWFHLPRAHLLIRARLEPWQRKQTKRHPVPVASAEWKDLLLEPLAWLKNFFNFFGVHLLENCEHCGGRCSKRELIGIPIGRRADWPTVHAECHRCRRTM